MNFTGIFFFCLSSFGMKRFKSNERPQVVWKWPIPCAPLSQSEPKNSPDLRPAITPPARMLRAALCGEGADGWELLFADCFICSSMLLDAYLAFFRVIPTIILQVRFALPLGEEKGGSDK